MNIFICVEKQMETIKGMVSIAISLVVILAMILMAFITIRLGNIYILPMITHVRRKKMKGIKRRL